MLNRPGTSRSLLVLLMAAGLGVAVWRTPRVQPVGTTAATRPAEPERSARGRDLAEGGQSGGEYPAPGVPDALFAFVNPPDAAALDQALPAPSHEINYVRVDRAVVLGKGSPFWRNPGVGRLSMPLPEGGVASVVIEGSEMLGPDRFTSQGRIEGRPGSRVLFAWNEGHLHASIEDPVLGSLALRVATDDVSQFYRVDPALVGPCGGERRPRPQTSAPRRSAASGRQDLTDASPAVAAAAKPQRAEVHVMMLYTQSVLPTMSGASRAAAIQSAFDLAIAKVNIAFEASLITARVRLVRVAETLYDETLSRSSQIQDDALTALYQENDGRMDEIHAWRDQAGADLVCLALSRRDSASSGLSFLLDTVDDPTNADFAFSVVEYSAVTGTNVVPHELGHVFGCAHDRENALSGSGAFSFSYGHRFLGADGRQYHDIMSYPPGTELSYFSNPDVIVPEPVNAPIGIAPGRPGESNSALTIERTAFTTAGYRLQTQAAAGAGYLVNVATRAFVGTGEEVLIGGFVIQGFAPKRMLIRAAGPALRAFGVNDALADPRLGVFADGVAVGENDNWTQPAGPGIPALAAEVSGAAARASAFAFPADSADSAVLITLPPGAYTAVIEGANGTTGQALVEAYEVDRTSARIANLATRGYAGRDGRELVGGFVVEGIAGSTKRILVRVLGPSLARPPFNLTSTLDDPELELRNAEGELLIKSDDWSNGALGGRSEENDFHPLVERYGEKQMFATGLAPSNRREPCVLTDLPPGSYTVTVRPFELRSSIPLRGQPARPGVGVLEVYEISP